jgi:two-component system C4-dicarboxylate transport response regulator DctD
VNARSSLAPCTVAVVDDDPTSTALLGRILSRAGFTVIAYESGEELLEHLATSRPDVICLDVELPGIDGLETLRRLQAIEPHLPAILFSASADAVRDEALGAGAFACVDKTEGWNGLRGAIERARGI